MGADGMICILLGLLAWWFVPPFVKPFSDWPGTMPMQAVGTVVFFALLTSNLPEDSPNYTPFHEWLSLGFVGVVVYCIYQFVNEQKGP